jgi:hypothetical protein
MARKTKRGKRWMGPVARTIRKRGHEGLARKKARREGLSLSAWAAKHRHDSNPTTRGEAVFARNTKRSAKRRSRRA